MESQQGSPRRRQALRSGKIQDMEAAVVKREGPTGGFGGGPPRGPGPGGERLNPPGGFP